MDDRVEGRVRARRPKELSVFHCRCRRAILCMQDARREICPHPAAATLYSPHPCGSPFGQLRCKHWQSCRCFPASGEVAQGGWGQIRLIVSENDAGPNEPVHLLPSPFSLLPSPFSLLPSPFSLLPSPVSRLPSPVSLLPSPVSRLLSPVSRLPPLQSNTFPGFINPSGSNTARTPRISRISSGLRVLAR